MWRAKDLSGLLLLYSAKGSTDGCTLSHHSADTAEVMPLLLPTGSREVHVASQGPIRLAAAVLSHR